MKRASIRVWLPSLLALLFLFATTVERLAAQATSIRLATYNIRFLDEDKLPHQGQRTQRLKQVVAALEADAIGMQEIRSREALKKIFDAGEWDLVIDDDSDDKQDLALAVRKATLEIVGLNADLDADPNDFLFPSNSDNFAFPRHRDVLKVRLKVKATGDEFTVFVVHLKARKDAGGRPATDVRRETAARKLIARLDQQFDGEPYILLCDLNDGPDDRCSNILETGDPAALAGPDDQRGPFLINLCEELIAGDHVSIGLGTGAIENGRVNTVVSGSRNLNNVKRGVDFFVRKVLLDNLFVSPALEERYQLGSVAVFDGPFAVEGGSDRASDHLPVSAVFRFGAAPMAAAAIVRLHPDPPGRDAGKETVTLKNLTGQLLSLSDWTLVDRGGRRYEFDDNAEIAAGATLTITLPVDTVTLTNSGDAITLLNAEGRQESRVEYTAQQADDNQPVTFP
ncbi:MAG: lamin tail domain-containing protein [Pirellulaceae bacterium]